MHQFSAVHFVTLQQLGKPKYYAPGLAVIASKTRREIRLQLVAHGPVAAAIHGVIAAETARAGAKSLDTSDPSRKA